MTKSSMLESALHYHRHPKPGKIAIEVTKPTDSQEDLSLAYSPGVAHPVVAIEQDPLEAYNLTAKGNLVAVATNGSAVLGLGNVGALASKPVMEGKAVLLKRFGDVDAFDIEIDCPEPDDFIKTVTHIAPTFGGIILEDIKAPECFQIEQALCSKLAIPVFHDDQHGTAIVVAAGLLNALELQGKSLADAKIVCIGAGAAGIASMQLLLTLGAKQAHITMLDRQGVIHTGRDNLGPYKQQFAQPSAITNGNKFLGLADAIKDADVFIGLSGPNILTEAMLLSMADKPIVFALSNPDPEIDPVLAHRTRTDLIMATGRSDFPNQVNNVLCFPYMFRGALDVRASKITNEMQCAAVTAIRQLVHEAVPAAVVEAYPGFNSETQFGSTYILPKPLDPRLRNHVANAVAQAAISSGVAQQ